MAMAAVVIVTVVTTAVAIPKQSVALTSTTTRALPLVVPMEMAMVAQERSVFVVAVQATGRRGAMPKHTATGADLGTTASTGIPKASG